MPRWQVLLALVAVSAGSVLAAAGPPGLARLGTLLLANLGWLLLTLGVLALLWAIAPRGALLGPLLLIGAGLVIIGWPRPEIWTFSGSAITVGGGLMLLRRGQSRRSDDPVVRRGIIGLAGRARMPDRCPEQIHLRPVVGRLTLSLFDVEPPSSQIVEVLITCWGGWVRLHVPPDWAVVGGRLAAATMISFSGKLDSKQLVLSRSSVDGKLFGELSPGPALVIVHVMGFGGGVDLSRQAPPWS